MTISEWKTWITNQGGLSSTPKADIQAMLKDWETQLAEKTAEVSARDREIGRLQDLLGLCEVDGTQTWKERAEQAEADRDRWKNLWDVAVHDGMRWKAQAEACKAAQREIIELIRFVI